MKKFIPTPFMSMVLFGVLPLLLTGFAWLFAGVEAVWNCLLIPAMCLILASPAGIVMSTVAHVRKDDPDSRVRQMVYLGITVFLVFAAGLAVLYITVAPPEYYWGNR